jgi:hypothetical protein
MSEQMQILHMQVRMVRIATEKFGISVGDAARLFSQYQVFEYIRDCFGIFHVEGDEAIWDDLILFLRSKGCSYA